MNILYTLDNEIWTIIISNIDLLDLINIQLVNKRFKKIINSQLFKLIYKWTDLQHELINQLFRPSKTNILLIMSKYNYNLEKYHIDMHSDLFLAYFLRQNNYDMVDAIYERVLDDFGPHDSVSEGILYDILKYQIKNRIITQDNYHTNKYYLLSENRCNILSACASAGNLSLLKFLDNKIKPHPTDWNIIINDSIESCSDELIAYCASKPYYIDKLEIMHQCIVHNNLNLNLLNSYWPTDYNNDTLMSLAIECGCFTELIDKYNLNFNYQDILPDCLENNKKLVILCIENGAELNIIHILPLISNMTYSYFEFLWKYLTINEEEVQTLLDTIIDEDRSDLLSVIKK